MAEEPGSIDLNAPYAFAGMSLDPGQPYGRLSRSMSRDPGRQKATSSILEILAVEGRARRQVKSDNDAEQIGCIYRSCHPDKRLFLQGA